MPAITKTDAWTALQAHRDKIAGRHLRDLLAEGLDSRLCVDLDGLHADLTRNRLDADGLDLLLALAGAAEVETWRARMYAGEKINTTEDNAVRHVALRDHGGIADAGIADAIAATLSAMRNFTETLRAGPTTDVVNIGIGGSHLGPMLATTALASAAPSDKDGPAVHYVANVDGTELATLLDGLDPATTCFLVASKTFTTQETMANAASARDWAAAALGADAVAGHFVAITANPVAARSFGIPDGRMFELQASVGGRYSLWSAVGLSTAVAIGWPAFQDLLDGAHAMDLHFRDAPADRNLPVLMALLGIWNTNFLGMEARAVLPYDTRLRYLPDYLQQLEMESNGKAVDRDGQPVTMATSPVIFGAVGTNGQHSFHQQLHQGPRAVACDFIAAARPGRNLAGHHDMLIANMLAQTEALALGSPNATPPERQCPGNRPSNTLLLETLDAKRLGMLIALYEHKVFVEGIIWNINSFDQFGVELGKRVAGGLLTALTDGDAAGIADSTSRALAEQYLAWRKDTP